MVGDLTEMSTISFETKNEQYFINISLGIKIVRIFIALIIVTGVVLHYPSTSAFFYNDDFPLLERVTYEVNFSDILKSFIPQGEILYKARLVGTLYYFICHKLFGFNPKAFHLVSLSIHIINTVLVFLIARKITKNDVVALISGLIFASHFALAWDVMWAGAIFDLTAGLFFFGTFLLYLYRDNNRFFNIFHICSLISFIFAVRSKEMTITLPAILFLYEITNSFSTKREIKKNLWQLLDILKKQSLYYVIGLIYILLTFKGSTDLPKEGPYAFKFDINTFLSGAKYFLNLLLLKPPFFNNIFFYTVLTVPIIASFVLKNRHLIFGFFYLWVTLLPVIFCPDRRYEFYLYIPILGFLFFVSNFVNLIANFLSNAVKNYRTIIKVTIVFGFLIAYGYFNYPQLNFTQFWIKTEARNFERCINQLKNLHPTLSKGSHLYFVGPPLTFAWFKHLVNISYNDPSLETFFINDIEVFGQGIMNEKTNLYVFNYTKRKLIDITNFCKKGLLKPHNAPSYIELRRVFANAEKKTFYPGHISYTPYCTANFESYGAILLGPKAKIIFDIELPENPIFETAIAVPQNLWNACDGVNFIVAINHGCACGDEVIFKKYIDPMRNESDRRWHDVEVDLSSFSNQKVRLILYSDSVGDDATAWTDWTAWADPLIIANPNKAVLKIAKD